MENGGSPLVPTTWTALLVLVAAVLPGAMFTYGFERRAGAFGVTLADRVLRFVAVSLLIDLLLAWPAYLLYRSGAAPPPWTAGRFAVAWAAVGVLLLTPAAAGGLVGELYATRAARAGRRRRLLPAATEARLLDLLVGRARAPRAWDHFLAQRPEAYLRVRTTDGRWLGGRFGAASRAATFPHDPDLYIEEAWPIADDGTFGDAPLGYPVYIASGTIAYLEVVPGTPEEVTADV